MTKGTMYILDKGNRLQESINEYFESCDESEGVYFAVQDLAKAIGISTKALISMNSDPDCNEIIRWALTVCAEQAEGLLLADISVDFAIKQLKLHGWEDKAELDITWK